MVTQKEIDRINALAKKSRTNEGLTPKEKQEQQRLRQLYLKSVRANMRGQLEQMGLQKKDSPNSDQDPCDQHKS